MHINIVLSFLSVAPLVLSQTPKQEQLKAYLKNTEGQTETTDGGTEDNTSASLRIGPRGYVLLEDTIARKKIAHFDRERQPERVVHALGHGAYGIFESAGDWSNITSACWLKQGAKSDLFTRFSTVVAPAGGSDVGRDTHGFAVKLYTACGNHDLVGNHLSSFFINDGILFPDLIHAVKAEPDKGFPNGGTAHTTAYDFFTQRPEGAFQLMNVLSDLGIPRDVRHIGGAGVHTYRFFNANGNSTLFKWYWKPRLGYRSLVYSEAQKIAGANNNFQRADLYNSIATGLYPQYDFQVQLFPDDGSYKFKGIDLLDATQVVPFELNQPITLGTMTLNRNPTNFFSEPENIAFCPSNVVAGISFVPDPLLAWRLLSYDDTAPHRHGSANWEQLPVNRPIAPVNNNYRDGYMQSILYEGASASSPNGIEGVKGAANNLPYGDETVNGKIGRYTISNDVFTQARNFWHTLDPYAQQHTVDAYRFELGHVADPMVQKNYISKILNSIDNCLARRVAYGLGVPLPSPGSAESAKGSANVTYPSQYPLAAKEARSVEGLVVGILASEGALSPADLAAIKQVFDPLHLMYEVVAPHQGALATGVVASASYVTTASVLYDAVIVGGGASGSNNATACAVANGNVKGFVTEAYGHGKPLGAAGDAGCLFQTLGYDVSTSGGVFAQRDAGAIAKDIVQALMGPGRYPQRGELDDASICK